MTYEEKFEIIVEAIREAKKYTPKGYDTKLKINDENKLLDLELDDIASVIYQLENTHKVIKPISTANVKSITGIDPWSDEQDFFALQVLPDFEAWYEEYILEQKTNIKNLDYINLLRIYDVVLDINEQIQLTHKTTVSIHLLPSIIRFDALFPGDTIGMRDKYCEARWDSLNYLKEKGVIEEFKHNSAFHRWDTVVTLSFKLSSFDDFYKLFVEEYRKHNKPQEETKKIEIDKSVKKNEETIVSRLSYIPQKGLLEIEGKKVQLQKDSFRAKLIELLLKDTESKKKEWSWDEVIEKIQGVEDTESLKDNKSKFYPACDGLSKFIAQKTGINDLLTYNKSTVQINPKYL